MAAAAKGIFAFTARLGATGAEQPLSAYADGYPVLIANVASKCGYTGQGYKDLSELGKKYGKKLHLLAFPCNQVHDIHAQWAVHVVSVDAFWIFS